MTATLRLDDCGRLLLPATMLRLLGAQPGAELTAEATPGRIELLTASQDDIPVISELAPDGTLRFPVGVQRATSEEIVSAIKVDRDARLGRANGR